MTTFAVLPVKRFDRAKQRLQPGVGPRDRRALAEAMVGDVLDTLAAVDGFDGVIVVSGEPAAQAAARAAGADVVPDAREQGQSAAALLGIERAVSLGAERVLLVPGDCPTLSAADIEALLGSGDQAPAVTIVADRHGTGTNALLLAPPDVIVPGFGPGSFERHLARATEAGLEARVTEVRALGLDVDTPDDLRALRATLDADPTAAPRTRAALTALATT